MKKLLSVVLVSALAISSLAGCGKQSSENTITVGASTTPHAEILKSIKSIVEEKGYKLEIQEFSDYVLPNTALEDGQLDANFFQHQPYLDGFNKEKGTNLVSAASIHFEPLAVYSNKVNHLSELQEGDSVAIPNDTTNEARALLLLQANDLITLKEDAGINATIKDIVENPLGLQFEELDAALIPRTLDDVTIAIINGNYALSAGLSVKDNAIATEDVASESAITYANILAVKADNKDSEKTKVLVEALTSDTCKDYINNTYNGVVVPMF